MFGRKKIPPPRTPHPDLRSEAQLQQVLALYAAVRRAEGRLADIDGQLAAIDHKARREAGSRSITSALASQHGQLTAERGELEAFIRSRYEEIAKLMAAMDEYTLSYLGPVP